jgi:sugar lactone lactonase YvrE
MKSKFLIISFLMIVLNINPGYSQKIIPLDYLKSIGGSGDNLGQFNQPQGIAIDLNENIYVADTGNNRVQKFDSNGKFQIYIGGIGSGSQQFDSPNDICSPDGLNVYVTDLNNNRIHILDRKLNSVSIFSGNVTFPKSLVVSKQGDIFIVETEENSILKFNSFYNPVARFGAIETGEGELNNPVKIELIENEFICVSDGQASRIVVFDYFCNFIKYLGEDILENPSGLLFWQEKKLLLVTDLDQQNIYAFNLDGENYVFQTLQKDEENKWRTPVDLAVSKDQLFVLDQDKNKILVYRILDIPELN